MKYVFALIIFSIYFVIWCFLKVASTTDREMEKDYLLKKK